MKKGMVPKTTRLLGRIPRNREKSQRLIEYSCPAAGVEKINHAGKLELEEGKVPGSISGNLFYTKLSTLLGPPFDNQTVHGAVGLDHRQTFIERIDQVTSFLENKAEGV